jgi:thymidylate kinase
VQLPVADIVRVLRALPGCVVLRNTDYIAHLKRGGDIDVIVDDVAQARHLVVETFGPPSVYVRSAHLESFRWLWGQLDLFCRVDWRGAEYVSADRLRAHSRRDPEGVALADPVHQGLICWLHPLIYGRFFKDRYRDLIVNVATTQGPRFREALIEAVGPRWAERLMHIARSGRPDQALAWRRRLCRAIRWRALQRAPIRTLRGQLEYYRGAAARWRTRPAPWFAVLGMDGSGKSSLIRAVASDLPGSGRVKEVVVGHWRPGVLGRRTEGPVTDPHGQPRRGWLRSLAAAAFWLADWWVGYVPMIVRPTARGLPVFFDRHFVDLVADPRRYRCALPRSVLSLLARCVPWPDRFIFLEVPPEVSRARKEELSAEAAEELRDRYRDLAQRLPRVHVIDAGRPLEDVVREVEQVVAAELEDRSRRALGSTWS